MKPEIELQPVTCPVKLRRLALQAIEDAVESLDCHEMEVLKLRAGLEDGMRRSVQEVSLTLGLSVSMVGKLEKSARRKALYRPLENLLKQAAGRISRHQKLGEHDGQADLELAIVLLRKSYRMAELMAFVSSECYDDESKQSGEIS